MHVFVSECVWELSSSRQKVAHAYNSNNSAWSAWLSVIARSFSYSLTRKSDSESESESVSRWEQAEIVSEVGASSAFVLLHAIQYYSIRLRIKLVSTECSAYELAYIQKTRYIHICIHTYTTLCECVYACLLYIFVVLIWLWHKSEPIVRCVSCFWNNNKNNNTKRNKKQKIFEIFLL